MTRKKKTRPTATATSESPQETVVITGISGRLGMELARRLHRRYRVIGIDRRQAPWLPRDVEHFRVELQRNRAEQVFRNNNIRAVFHMDILHNLRRNPLEHHRVNLLGLQRLLSFVRKYKVPKLVVLSTADVYGPSAENVTFLTEDAPLLAAARFGAIRDLISVDMTALSFMWQHHDTETIVLRPVHVVGAVRNAAMSYLSRDWCPVPMGFDPLIQLVHQNDVVRAMELCMKPGLRGVFNIDGPSAVPVSVVLRELNKKSVPVPDFMLRSALSQMWRMHLTRFPPPEVDHIQWPATVDGSRARKEMDYAPEVSLSKIFSLIRDGDPLTDRLR